MANDADELIPSGEAGWDMNRERSSKMSTKNISRFEEEEDEMVAQMGNMKVTKDDKASITDFQKKLFGGDGVDGMIKTGNKGISRRKLYEEMMTTLELNGIAKNNHTSEVIKQSILALVG